MAENRTGKRFPLQLPIRVHKTQAAGDHKAVTGNLSAAGVYIHADAELQVGSQIEFEITLPSDIIGGNNDVRVRCQGRVVRRERPHGDKGGVACVIDNYKFVRGAQQ